MHEGAYDRLSGLSSTQIHANFTPTSDMTENGLELVGPLLSDFDRGSVVIPSPSGALHSISSFTLPFLKYFSFHNEHFTFGLGESYGGYDEVDVEWRCFRFGAFVPPHSLVSWLVTLSLMLTILADKTPRSEIRQLYYSVDYKCYHY